jgi:hypothetical protein
MASGRGCTTTVEFDAGVQPKASNGCAGRSSVRPPPRRRIGVEAFAFREPLHDEADHDAIERHHHNGALARPAVHDEADPRLNCYVVEFVRALTAKGRRLLDGLDDEVTLIAQHLGGGVQGD